MNHLIFPITPDFKKQLLENLWEELLRHIMSNSLIPKVVEAESK